MYHMPGSYNDGLYLERSRSALVLVLARLIFVATMHVVDVTITVSMPLLVQTIIIPAWHVIHMIPN